MAIFLLDDVSIADKSKKLKDLNKKWGKQKPEKFYRFVFMRPTESFVRLDTLPLSMPFLTYFLGTY